MVGGQCIELASACQCNGSNPRRSRGRQSPQDIFGLAGRCQPDGDVAGRCEGFDLPGEDLAITEVVGDTGHETRTSRQANGRQRGSCELEATDKLTDEMVGLCRAPSVSESKDLPSRHEAIDQDASRRFDLLTQLIAAESRSFQMRVELRAYDFDQFTHRLVCSHGALPP